MTALLGAFALFVSLAACGAPDTTPPTGDGTAPVPSPGVAATPAITQPLKVVTTSESYVTLFDAFTADTGVKVEFLSLSSGEVLSKVKAEGGAPMADLWFGGGIDAFMQAQADGLLEPVTFEAARLIEDAFKDSEGYWYAKGITVVGFLVNNDLLAEEKLTPPRSWGDLVDPAYKGEILMSNPAISGTNYAVVNAILQQKGEEDGWAYFEALNENIDYYAKRGKDPNVKCVAGEVAVGITYIDGTITKLEAEQNVSVIYPSDGIPYIPDGVAAFKGASNLAAAKLFVEWLYGDDDNLRLLAEIDQKNYIKLIKPTIEGMEVGFDIDTLMEEDLSLFGANRTAILDRWAAVVGDKETRE